MNDFKEEPYPLYISEFDENITWIVVLIIILIIGTTLIIVYIKRRKINNPTATKYIEEQYTVDLTSNEFNTIETSLINKLIEKSNQKSHLTVDELNSYLGIKKKTIEIQKRVRTEAINRINHKFNIKFNIESTFIERTRSIEDRRYFNYIINKENATIYLGK
jgi:NhaP-type Na+/H+ and K+/H+ antiporter